MPYRADGTWEPEDDTVSTRLTGLLKTDQPLMQQARTTGLQQANKRGLLNSTMAVGAAENEAIKAALPIAIQESGQVAQRNLSAQGFAQTGQLQTANLASQERVAAADIEARNFIARMNVASHDRELAASAVSAASAQYGTLYAQIEGNQNIPAERRAADLLHILALRDTAFNLIQQLYSVSLDWGQTAAAPAAP